MNTSDKLALYEKKLNAPAREERLSALESICKMYSSGEDRGKNNQNFATENASLCLCGQSQSSPSFIELFAEGITVLCH